jgi:hypothetical protein
VTRYDIWQAIGSPSFFCLWSSAAWDKFGKLKLDRPFKDHLERQLFIIGNHAECRMWLIETYGLAAAGKPKRKGKK